jgi:DNA-binding NarL/FixJ family response regulator
VLSGSEVIRQGIIGLLPEDWQDHAVLVSDATTLADAVGEPCIGAIIDAEASSAEAVAEESKAHGVAVVVLTNSATDQLAGWIVENANAILVRDRVDQLRLRMAILAGQLGLELLPRASFEVLTGLGEASGPPLGDQARRALVLLADGQRDADIARALNLSESAVHKLVQRAVRDLGARTRCQAVALAARRGQLY